MFCWLSSSLHIACVHCAHVISGAGNAVRMTGPHPPELAVGNNTSTIFAKKGKSYSSYRDSLTDIPGGQQYHAPVSSNPQGLDFSPLLT